MPLLGRHLTPPLALAVLLLVGAVPNGAVAQAPVVLQPPTGSPQPPDSLRPVVAPLPAFFRSLILPGWGQALLDRKLTGGLFLLWEGVTLGMTVKTAREVAFIRDTEDTRQIPEGARESFRLRAKKAEHQDWLVLLIFNHLFSGLEAFVSAHLWDFPVDLRLQALPAETGPRPGLGMTIPFRWP